MPELSGYCLSLKRQTPVHKFETGYPIIIWSRSMGEEQPAVDGYQQRAINFFKVTRIRFLLVDIDKIDDFRFLLMRCCPGQLDTEILSQLNSHQLPIVLLNDEIVCSGSTVFSYFNWLEQLKYEQYLDNFLESRLQAQPPQLRIPLRGDFYEFYPLMQIYRVSALSLDQQVFDSQALKCAHRFMKLRFLEIQRPPPVVTIDEDLPDSTKAYVTAKQLVVEQSWAVDDWSHHERSIRRLAFAAPLDVETDDPNVVFLQHRFCSPSVSLGNASCWLQIRGAVPSEDSELRQVVLELCFSEPIGDVLVQATVFGQVFASEACTDPTSIDLGLFDFEDFMLRIRSYFADTGELNIPWSVHVCASTDGLLGQWLRRQLDTEAKRVRTLGARCLESLVQSESQLRSVPSHLFEHYQTEILSQRTQLDQPTFFCRPDYLASIRANFGGDWIQHVLTDLFLSPLELS